MKNAPVTIIIIDDHFVVRSGLAASLELEEEITVLAEGERGEDALVLFETHAPRVVVMDLQLPGISGIEATRQLCDAHPEARILIFSTFARDDEIQAALEAGAAGYLQKSAERGELILALHDLAGGRSHLPSEIADRLEALRVGPVITSREREILALIARGKANKEIAAELGIAEDTVKRHASNAFQKLEVSDRAGATAEAIRRGIIRIDP